MSNSIQFLSEIREFLLDIIYDFIIKKPTGLQSDTRGITSARKKCVKERDNLRCQLCGESYEEEELLIIFFHIV